MKRFTMANVQRIASGECSATGGLTSPLPGLREQHGKRDKKMLKARGEAGLG